VFYFASSGTLIGFIGTLTQGFSPHDARLGCAAGRRRCHRDAGSAGNDSRLCYGNTLVVANLQFVAVVAASLLGIAVFGDHIPLLGGSALRSSS